VPLVGQRPQRLRQQPQLLDAHRQLAGLRPEQRALGADDVAHVPALERVVGLAERGGLQEQLQLPRAIGDLGEARLAHDALEHHAAADVHAHGIGLQRLVVELAVRAQQFGRERVAAKIVGKRLALVTQRGELHAALGDELVLIYLGRRGLLRCALRRVASGRVPCGLLFVVAHSPAFRLASMN
jgi:hypothetical protein